MTKLEYAIYGYMAFSAVCLLTFLWAAHNAVPVDDNGYPVKKRACQIIPFPAKAKNRKAA